MDKSPRAVSAHPPCPASPGHFCSSSFKPPTPDPGADHPQPSFLLHQWQWQQQHLCRRVRREGFPLAFYSTFIFALLLCCWCFRSPSPSEHALLVESHKLGCLMRPFKVQGLILSQWKSGKKRHSLVIIFHGQSCTVQSREDSIWPLSEANVAADHCIALKCFPPKLLMVFWPSYDAHFKIRQPVAHGAFYSHTNCLRYTRNCRKIPYAFSSVFSSHWLFFSAYLKEKIEKN